MRALVAIGDASTLQLVTAVLARAGFDVDVAQDAEDALLRLCDASIAVVICCTEPLANATTAQLCTAAKERQEETRVVLLRQQEGAAISSEPEVARADAILPLPLQAPALRNLLGGWGLLKPAFTIEGAGDMRLAIPPVRGAPQAFGLEGALRDELDSGRIAFHGGDDPEWAADSDASSAGMLPEALPSRGDLDSTPLPRIVYELYASAFTGVLILCRLGMTRSIYFAAGFPVWADSSQLTENLGRLLLSHGRITEEDYEGAQSIVNDFGVRQGAALLWNRAIEPGELHLALLDQTEHKVANAFAWRDGTYEIRAGAELDPGKLPAAVHPLKIVWRGVCEHYDVPSLQAFLEDDLGDYFIVPTRLYRVHGQALGLFLRALDVARVLDGCTTFKTALLSDTSPHGALAQALYVLVTTNMVYPSVGAGPPLEEVLVAAPDAGEHAAGPTAETAELAAFHAIVTAGTRIAAAGDCFRLLGASLAANEDDIVQCYESRAALLHLERFPAGLGETMRTEALMLLDALSRARDTLLDKEQRERHTDALQRGEQAPMTDTRKTDASVEAVTEAAADSSGRIAAERTYREGLRLLNAGQCEAAAAELREAIRLAPDEPLFFVGLGMAALIGGDPSNDETWRQAGCEFLRALRIDPSCAEANLAMAKMLFETEHWLGARPYVLRVLQRAPESQIARAMLEALDKVEQP